MVRPLRVYIAGPLNGSGRVSSNLRIVLALANVLRSKGYVPFVPHLYFFWDAMFPMPEEHWLALDKEWLEACDVLFKLDGDSPGRDKEVGWARDFGIPIVTSIDDLEELKQRKDDQASCPV